MEYREFISEVKGNILSYMPPEYAGADVMINDVMKNNGVLRHGLVIKQEGAGIAPNMYMDSFYEAYQNGAPMQEVCSKMAEEYVHHMRMGKDFDIEYIKDFDKVRDKITTKVVNAKSNRALLMERPSMKLDDLAVLYQVEVGDMAGGSASIPVTNEMMKVWDVSVSDIHSIAVENRERLFPIKMMDMKGVLFGAETNFLSEESKFEESNLVESPLLILTNEARINGATVLADTMTMEKVADALSDSYYVLPSSIHEVLIIPKQHAEKMGMKTKELGDIVRDVNANALSRDEFLSDHVYEFDRDKRELLTVKDSKEKNKDFER